MTYDEAPGDALAAVFEFSVDDLAANHAGHLTDGQRSRVTAAQQSNAQLAKVAFGLFFGVGLFGLSIEVRRSAETTIRTLGIYLLAAAAIGVLAWALGARARRRMEQALEAAEIRRVAGAVTIVEKRLDRHQTIRRLYVGDARFEMEDRRRFDRLVAAGVDGHEAIAFVLVGSHRLLSIELVT